ncbi:endo-1,4-beta-xylanase [Gracilibacillus massiliensis]|uniref:endo-1,4-beta-xylanase n=1 Tax=Gracilibacillus massiliensis TaxID=1564956 RepID=UPI00071C63B8|nr:endo-1,4-beta-xylanase [Gracilibacillus massiliensis]
MLEANSLYKKYEKEFKIGAAINHRTMYSAEKLIDKHFNSLTAENEMKFENLHPAEDEYVFEISDEMIKFAQKHDKAMRGHTLIWHNQTSDWIFEKNGKVVDAITLQNRMKDHIDTVVGRYKGKIYSWDVVNEVISDEKDIFYRNSKWYEIMGESFIEKAFDYAHKADPGAKLLYNDYNESDPIKRDKIFQLVKQLKDKHVPIHGVGMQAHWNIYDPTLDNIRSAIEKYASLGVEVQITEMDVSMFASDDKRTDLTAPTEKMIELQHERYLKFFEIFKEYSQHIGAVTFWGVADDYTWLDNFPVRGRKNWPFLFDQNQEPKDVLQKIVE